MIWFILSIVFAVLTVVFMLIRDGMEKEWATVFIMICAFLTGVIWTVFLTHDEIQPLDVYRGKTTLEITYRDSVAIDSTVVYKVK